MNNSHTGAQIALHPDVTVFCLRAKQIASAGWLALDAVIPWFLVLAFLLLPVAVVFGRLHWMGVGMAFFGTLLRLVKGARAHLTSS